MRIYAGIPAFVLMLMLQLSAGSAESVADNRRLFCGSRMRGIFGQNEQQPPEEKR